MLWHMQQGAHSSSAYSLVELLVVIAVIAVIAGLVVSSMSGTKESAHTLIARQQQAELQTALNNWISRTSSQPGGLAEARSKYNSASDKLLLLSGYLQDSTVANLSGAGNVVSSTALISSGARLHFTSGWTTTNTPAVTWSNTP